MNKSGLIYLNEAATAWPLAPGVTEAMLSALSCPIISVGRGEESYNSCSELCREAIAESLSINNPANIVLTNNATHSLNIAISGLDAKCFRKVITTVYEHNSVLRPIRYRVEKEDGKLIVVGLNENGDFDTERIIEEIQNGATLVIISHASNLSGYLLPVEEIFKCAKEYGAVTILDAAQTWGIIPVNPVKLSADIIAITGHKGMRGPTGTGGLYISDKLNIVPTFTGGTGIWSDYEYQPSEMPVKLEIGTPNEHGIAGLYAAINWNKANQQEMKLKADLLFNKLMHGLTELPGVTIKGYSAENRYLPIISFTINNWTVDEIGYILDKSYNIKCRTGLHCAPLLHKEWGTFPTGTVRFSMSGFNTEGEIDLALSALGKIIKCG